ncbi:MAG: hypothetical protein ACOY3H_06045 [Bacillota bacterium]
MKGKGRKLKKLILDMQGQLSERLEALADEEKKLKKALEYLAKGVEILDELEEAQARKRARMPRAHDPNSLGGKDLRAKVVEVLQNSPMPLAAAQILQSLTDQGLTPRSKDLLLVYLAEMAKQGEIVRPRRGYYTVPEAMENV